MCSPRHADGARSEDHAFDDQGSGALANGRSVAEKQVAEPEMRRRGYDNETRRWPAFGPEPGSRQTRPCGP
eukprot:129509-Alexandrium_andersonii.AAC.1